MQSCLDKQAFIKEEFLRCKTKDELYRNILSFGTTAPPFPPQFKTEDRLVLGCQSNLYLFSEYVKGTMHFLIDSEALISKGLASLLVYIYDGEAPETILLCKPTVLEEVDIIQSLSSTRVTGVMNLYTKMQQKALLYA